MVTAFDKKHSNCNIHIAYFNYEMISNSNERIIWDKVLKNARCVAIDIVDGIFS